jgi:hypothetical protein
MTFRTYLCPKSEAESTETIKAFSEFDKATTAYDNDNGQCLIICSDNTVTSGLAKHLNLEDVTQGDENPESDSTDILTALERLGNACIEYVGSANYQSRENAALEAFRRGIVYAKVGNLKALNAVRIISRG